MARERCLDCNLRSFKVADFSDHDHIRVLAQYGSQGFGKGEVDLGIDLGLPHACQLIFDRVFHCHDIAVTGVHALQGSV